MPEAVVPPAACSTHPAEAEAEVVAAAEADVGHVVTVDARSARLGRLVVLRGLEAASGALRLGHDSPRTPRPVPIRCGVQAD